MRWWCRSQKVGVAIILDSRESKIDGSACVDRIIGAGRDMRTIWDVSAQRDNEEAEAGQGVGQPTSIGHLGHIWDTTTTNTNTGKTAINTGQMVDRNGKSQTHRRSPNPAPGFSEIATISCLPFVATFCRPSQWFPLITDCFLATAS